MPQKAALVVIDMQDDYEISEDEKLLNNVIKHIRMAKKAEAPIVVLEYVGMGSTREKILDELENYEQCRFTGKVRSDGSTQVKEVLSSAFGIKSGLVKACGIFSSDCVKATVEGLVDKGFRVNVVEEACGAWSLYHKEAMKSLRTMKNAKVVYVGPDYRGNF